MALRDKLVDICLNSSLWEDGMEERLYQELSHIESGEYEAYYLRLYDQNIKIDTQSHLIAYLMGLSKDYDPDKFPEQTGDMPDIDVDFADRKIVMEYLKEKYGDDYVSYINNYTKLKGKSAVRDVARVLEVSVPSHLEEIMTEGGDDWSVKKFWEEMDEEIYEGFSEEEIEVLKKAVHLEGNLRQMGVCFGAGTPIRMFDSTVKNVEDIEVGDRLMGHDSTPRTVLSLANGREEMFKVHQDRAMNYVVNRSHILSLRRGANYCSEKRGEITNITVHDYLSRSKGWKVGMFGYKKPVEYLSAHQPIEPYFLGLWLGDGHSSSSAIFNIDKEIPAYLKEYAKRRGLGEYVKECSQGIEGKVCPKYHLTAGNLGSNDKKTSTLTGQLRTIGVLNNKHIPDGYLISDREQRLHLLAGLIDSDGYKNKGNGPYEITLRNKILIEDIKSLCDSLGYATTLTERMEKTPKHTEKVSMWRLTFNGDTSEIPVLLPRKKGNKWTSIRDWKNTRISLESLGEGDYYGFELDGDRMFLLEDGTVAHNTAAGAIISNVPVEEYTSLYINKDSEIVSVFDKKDVEKIGFIKFDILLVKNIGIIQKTLEVIEQRGGTIPENIWDIPYDPKMMEEFRKGNTSLIFQYQGKALKGLLPKLKPDSISDLVAANALCRPGADDEGYSRRKNGQERVSYPHKALQPILKNTYGVITYQEDIMKICRDIAGMMHKDVERVRKMIGRKDTSEADELKEFFVRGCRRYGIPDNTIESIWTEIMKAGDYAFNKSHAVAYFLIGWANMYLQVYHPLEWILGNLIIADDDTKKITIFSEAKRLGIDIDYVDVNRSKEDWSYDNDILVPGLEAVPGVGPKAAREISEKAPYESFEDMEEKLPKRAFNKTVREALSRAGAIPGVEGEKIFRSLASGHPIDITEDQNIHPAWRAKPVSNLDSKPMTVHGYLMSSKKVGTDYQLNIIGDDAIKLYYPRKLDPGPYLFVVDSYDFAHVYYACPLEKAHKHPVSSRDTIPVRPLSGRGPGFAFLGSTKKTKKGKFVSLVMTPELITVWLDKYYEKGFYVFEKHGRNFRAWTVEEWSKRGSSKNT